MQPSIIIRNANENDMAAVLRLINELAIYENAATEVINSVSKLKEEGFGDQPAFECIVAETRDEVIGFALFFQKYSTWKGKSIFLEDLCVTESYRRKGIGQLLFDKVLAIAQERKMKRLDWQVLDWNTPAIEFYKKYQAELDATWINGRIAID